jgi:lipopolysaccharide export system permease protein
MNLLDRYILRAIFGSTVLVMTVLLILGALFTFIGQQDDIGVGRYTALNAFWFTMLNMPQQAWELLPIGAMIGSLLGLGSLARGSEITVMRASGVSIVRFAASVLVAAIALILIEIALGEFLAPPLQQVAKQQKAFDKFTNVTVGSTGGSWVRDGDLILNVSRQSSDRQFAGMLIFELSPNHRLRAIGRASRATAETSRGWLLSGYQESRFTAERVLTRPVGQRILQSNVTAGFLGLAVTDPRQLETRSLWRLIQYYETNQLDARPYVFAFWSRIARVVAIAFSVLLAVPFVLGSMRASGTGARMMIGLLIGVGFFLVQRLIESGTVVFDLNPVLLAWIPTALLATITLALLSRAR